MNKGLQNMHNNENNYPKAIAIASGIMGVLLLISFFIVIGSFQPPEDLGMGGMVVNYGTSAEGMGDDYTSIDEPSADPNANKKAPEKVTEKQEVTPTSSNEKTEKEIVTQNTEDAVAINTKATKTSTKTPTTATEDKPAKPVINQNALYKGKKNTGQGNGDGTGNTAGNQGDKDGDPLASNYGEGGSGFGNKPIDVGSLTNFVKPDDLGQVTGKIVIKIIYNNRGRIISATQNLKGSTTADLTLVNKCIAALMKSSVNKVNDNGEGGNRTGIITIRFGVN